MIPIKERFQNISKCTGACTRALTHTLVGTYPYTWIYTYPYTCKTDMSKDRPYCGLRALLGLPTTPSQRLERVVGRPSDLRMRGERAYLRRQVLIRKKKYGKPENRKTKKERNGSYEKRYFDDLRV
jgi:hypothetical protein